MGGNSGNLGAANQVTQGSLVFDHGLPAAGITTRIYNIGFGGQEIKLGETKSDAQGNYSLTYSPNPTGAVATSINLQVRVMDPAGKEVTISYTKFNAQPQEMLNLVVPSSVRPLVPDTDGGQHQGERTHYIYNSSGQRVRKVTEYQKGTLVKERIYLGAFELYREYSSSGATTLERQSLHVMDDKQRVALVEARTQGDDGTAAQLIRYEFGNHLGSACLELNDEAQIISYEEHYPYGSTSYQAVDSSIKAAAKRYRFTGMERDEESGLNYKV